MQKAGKESKAFRLVVQNETQKGFFTEQRFVKTTSCSNSTTKQKHKT